MRRKADRPLINFYEDGSFEPLEISWSDIDKWVLPEKSKSICKMIYRLAEYERTGLGPGDVSLLHELYTAERTPKLRRSFVK